MSYPLRLFQFSDLHLGRNFPKMSPDKNRIRQDDFKKTLQRLIDLAIKNKADALLIPGDLFDSYLPSLSLIEYVRAQFERLNETKAHIFLLPGNHDYWLSHASPASRLLWSLPRLHVFTEDRMERQSCRVSEEQLHVYGYPFREKGTFIRPLKDFRASPEPGLHIVMIHGSYQEKFVQSSSYESDLYHPVSSAEIEATGVDYVAMGHFHSFQKCGTSTPAYYAGSPEGTRMHEKESGERYALDIVFDRKKRVTVTKLPVQQREIRVLHIDLPWKNQNDLHEKLRDMADPKLILSIKLSGVARTMEELTDSAGLSDRFSSLFFHLKVDTSRVVCGEKLTENLPEHSPESVYVQVMDQQIRQASDPEEKRQWTDALLTGLVEIMEKA